MSIVVDQLKMTPPAALTSTAASQVVQLTAGGNLILALPGSGRFSANSFTVYAAGYAQSGPGTFTATVQPILYGDASLATVTTKPLFSCTAGTLAYTGTATGAIPWNITAEFEGDNTSQALWGNVTGQVGSTFKSPTVSVATASAINFQTEPPVKFAIGNTCGGTVGGNFKFVVTQFQIIEE